MDDRARDPLERWVGGLSAESRQRYFMLLDELCRGLDVSKHDQFGFLRLRAEFETSGEIFGCTLDELRDAVARALGEPPAEADRPLTPLEELCERIARSGHPDFR